MRLVILDRDGVINHDSAAYIKSAAEWIPIRGSLEAIARLNRAGYRVVVASNQSGLARGLFSAEDLTGIHDKMQQALAAVGGHLDEIFFCPHGPADDCDCRKPKPGLLLAIAGRLHADLHEVPIVGDALRDMQAAQAVGARPVLVLTGQGAATLERGVGLSGIEIYADLSEAVDVILAGGKALKP